MQRTISGLRDKLMIACALVAACVLAAPSALAHDRYRGGSHDADVLGALVVGAVIGGVLVGASRHQDEGYYYPAQPYGPVVYDDGPYYDGGYYAYPDEGYGGAVSVGVYSGGGGYYYDRGYRGPRGYYRGYDGRGDYDRDGRSRGGSYHRSGGNRDYRHGH
jgi:hypothetical protein